MKRTDVHRPSALVTEDYEFAYAYDAHPEEGSRSAVMPLLNALIDQGWRFDQVHGGDTCDHCGARLRYVAVMKHIPTHTLIKVGEQCLDNRFDLATPEFHRLRKQAALNRDRMARIDKLNKWLEADPRNAQAYGWLELRVEAGDYGWNGFYHDLLHKTNRYGDLSEKQVDAVHRAMKREAEHAAKKAAEAATASPVIEGKIVVTGEVVTVKWQDNAYGGSLKMLVKDDRGFKVWGTVPSALDSEFTRIMRERREAGEPFVEGNQYKAILPQRVTFTATVEKSNDDETFGFYKRPTKPALA